MRAILWLAATLAVAGLATSSSAADQPSAPAAAPRPAEPAVDELLRQSGDTSGIWEAVDKKRVHHLQSGLVCEAIFLAIPSAEPAKSKEKPLAALPLQSVSIVASDRPRGDDVACNYEIPGGPLVVIEAIRFKDGEDTRDVFYATEKELGAKFSRFSPKPAPFGVQLQLVVQGELGQGARLENYTAEFEGQRYIATLMVGPVRHWAVLIYAVGASDNEILQQVMVNAQWLTAARWVLATSISRGEPAP